MVSREQIQALADEIASKFDVEKIILFGSYAYGTPTQDSDVDLLVLMEHEGRRIDQSLRLWKATRPEFSCQFVVYRRADAEGRYQVFDPVVCHAFDWGVPLYERETVGVD